MALNTSNKITLIGAFGAAILTGLIFIGIREWYSPDIRYEEGPFYISGKNAITSLKLENNGHGDAEDVNITAHFDNNINDISIDDKSLEIHKLGGGIGGKIAVIKISRIVPNYSVIIYFSIDNQPQEMNLLRKRFISNITYKGGIATTGKPVLFDILFLLSFTILFFIAISFITYRWVVPKILKLDKIEKVVDEQGNLTLDTIICFTRSLIATENQLSLNDFLSMIEKIQNDKSKSSFDKLHELCNLCKTINPRSDSQKDKS